LGNHCCVPRIFALYTREQKDFFVILFYNSSASITRDFCLSVKNTAIKKVRISSYYFFIFCERHLLELFLVFYFLKYLVCLKLFYLFFCSVVACKHMLNRSLVLSF